ncbi:nucleotide exchange factor GrpE [Candidatus Peregrinibacteria bacterium]|nr:nucleotide exchange factor GrpE [Candidatus Peregrinibacteria bacterium]
MFQDDQNPGTNPVADSNSNDSIDLTTLQTELEETKNKLAELTAISQHALADLQNFKKRSEEEKSKFVIYANATLISDILPILDNLDRALTHLPEDPTARNWAEGILATAKQLENLLTDRGLETINTEGNFDPNLHEAVLTENGTADQIIRSLEKGYKLSDRVLRRSKVVVGNGQTAAEASPQSPL